jgi:serine protease Do
LGIRVAPVTEEVIRNQQLVVRQGAVIAAIEQGSAADRAGLPIGAVIVALNGRRIDGPDDLAISMQSARPGQDVELTYYYKNKLARKKVHLAATSQLPETVIVPSPPTRTLSPPPAPIPAPGTRLERELGADGSRPLLGRLGRVIDGLAAPAQAVNPVEPPVAEPLESDSEVAELRRQLAELTKQVATLRRQVESLEKKLSEREAPVAP